MKEGGSHYYASWICHRENVIKPKETEGESRHSALLLHPISCFQSSLSSSICLAISPASLCMGADSWVFAPAMFEIKWNSQKQNSGVVLNICLSQIFPHPLPPISLWHSPLINVLTSRREERHCGETDCISVGVLHMCARAVCVLS